MRVLNKQERTSAFLWFLLFFVVTVGLFVLAVFFNFQVPSRENTALRKQLSSFRQEQAFQAEFLQKMDKVKNNLDSIKNLLLFLKAQQTLIGTAIGDNKAEALVKITEGIEKSQLEHHREAATSINELLNIVSHIQEILNIQRQFVRGHGGSHERKSVNIAHIIDDSRSMLFASFDKRGVKLNINVKPGNHVIKGDHTKLMQVILNILKNSLEAIDMESDNKSISVFLETIDDYISLKIVDTGQGFDEETSRRFFERGFTTKKSGTGLGLYNCKSIVESHAGSFNISSEGVGKGATISIKFAI